MYLTKNMQNNFKALLAIALNTRYDNITLLNHDIMDDTFILNFERKISINHLKKLNNYFKTDIRSKTIFYKLIVNKNTNTIKLHIEDIENQQLTLFDNDDELNNKIKCYDEKITNRLYEFSSYLYETIYQTDTEIKEWTFYYVSYKTKHIGFANKDYANTRSIKLYARDYKWFKDDDVSSFYEQIYKLVGTKNDADIMCLRRNYNSSYDSNWKVCIYGTPIHKLDTNNILSFN